MKRTFLIITHLIVTLLAYIAWLWLDYRVIVAGALIHLGILWLFRGCPLSHAQFPEDKTKRFYEWWLQKLGVVVQGKGRYRLHIFMKYLLPLIIIALAIALQVGLSVRPIISL